MKRGRLGQDTDETQLQQRDLLQPPISMARNPVEPFFNRIRQCRRIATRYDRLAADQLAFARLASSGYGCVDMGPRA